MFHASVYTTDLVSYKGGPAGWVADHFFWFFCALSHTNSMHLALSSFVVAALSVQQAVSIPFKFEKRAASNGMYTMCSVIFQTAYLIYSRHRHSSVRSYPWASRSCILHTCFTAIVQPIRFYRSRLHTFSVSTFCGNRSTRADACCIVDGSFGWSGPSGLQL